MRPKESAGSHKLSFDFFAFSRLRVLSKSEAQRDWRSEWLTAVPLIDLQCPVLYHNNGRIRYSKTFETVKTRIVEVLLSRISRPNPWPKAKTTKTIRRKDAFVERVDVRFVEDKIIQHD